MPDFETDGVEHLNDPAYQGRRHAAKASKFRPVELGMALISHGQLLWFVYSGSLSYVDLLVIFSAEVIIITQLTLVLHPPEQANQFASTSVTRFIAMIVVLILLIGEYALSLDGPATSVFAQFHAHDLFTGFVYMAIQFGGIFFAAKRTANPKLAWARGALVGQGAAFITLFAMPIFGFFAAGFVLDFLHHTRPDVKLGAVLAMITVFVHFGAGLWASAVSQDDIMDIYKRPT